MTRGNWDCGQIWEGVLGSSLHKAPYTLWLSADIAAMLKCTSVGQHGSRSAIVEDAIRHFFSPGEDERFSIMARRLDQMQLATHKMSEQQWVSTELLGCFIELFLMATPPLSPDEQEIARARSQRHFQILLTELRTHMRHNEPLAELILADQAALEAARQEERHDTVHEERVT